MIFAKQTMQLSKDLVIRSGQRVPEDKLDPGAREELLARGIVTEAHAETVVKTPLGVEITKPEGPTTNPKWDFDPKKLEEKSLDDLNLMIVNFVQKSKIAEVEPFDDKKEAIFFMSKDRETPKKK